MPKLPDQNSLFHFDYRLAMVIRQVTEPAGLKMLGQPGGGDGKRISVCFRRIFPVISLLAGNFRPVRNRGRGIRTGVAIWWISVFYSAAVLFLYYNPRIESEPLCLR